MKFLFFLLPLSALAQELILNDSKIKDLARKSSPTSEQIEASFLMATSELAATQDKYTYNLEASAQKNRSNEKTLNQFEFVNNRQQIYSLGINKMTPYGVGLSVGAFGTKTSNTILDNLSSAGMSVGLNFDLYKNFLGRLSKAEIEKNTFKVKKAGLEKDLALKVFESNVRKLFWQLVAIEEKNKLLTGLVELSSKQLSEAQKRKTSGVADSGEVAKYQSQYATRKADILSLKYQRGNTLKSLKELLPEIQKMDITLAPYNVEEIIQSVLICTNEIRSYKEVPLQYTPYDEMAALTQKQSDLELKINRSYNDMDVKLLGQYDSVGKGFGLDEARQDFSDDGRARTQLALTISVPLGSSKKTTEETRKKLIAKKNHAMASSYLAKIKAYHSETAEMIGVLRDVVKSQKDTNKYLSQSLAMSQKKYRQARLSVQELVGEQDLLLQSRLSEIDTNLQIIYTLMDYFSVFPQTKCQFN
jgi:outer membrane protein TolC